MFKMRRNFIITRTILFNTGILLSLFVFGGIVQISGVLSITKTNFIIFLGMMVFLLISTRNFYLKDGSQYIRPLCCLSLYIVLNAFFTKAPAKYCIVYIYLFTLLPFVGVMFSEKMLGRNENTFDFTRSFFFFIAVFQIPVLFFQIMFADEISVILGRDTFNLGLIDMYFGSFFIKSDYTLTLLMNVLLVNVLWYLKIRGGIRYIFIAILFCAIAMTNSKMGLIVFFIIINIYWMDKLFQINLITLAILLPTVSVILILLVFNVDFHALYNNFFQEVNWIEHRASKGEVVPRYAVLLAFMFEKVNLWGYGLFDYYNYFSMEWKFYAGHSLWLTIYNDVGLFGVLLTLWLLWSIIHKSIRKTSEGLCYFSILVCYSFISVLFSDLGAMVIVFFFMQTFPRFLKRIEPEAIKPKKHETQFT